ncbi:hypothetical protein F5880DRAFT_1617250 [Lentinula raphanica]|nr:hypothetical protein F5880DRAFT_1617250 [Lentinula raphanica]
MLQIDHIIPRPPSPSADREESEPALEHDAPLRVLSTSSVSNRRHDHLNQVRARLTAWRDDTYDDQPWGPHALLPPTVLTAIATKARLRTIDDFISIAGWEDVFAHTHGAEVLALLSSLDNEHHATIEQEKIERAEARHRSVLAKHEETKRIRAEEKLARNEAKRVQREEKIQAAQASKERKAREKAAERARKAAEKATRLPPRRGHPPAIPLSPKNTDRRPHPFTPTAHDSEATQNISATIRPRPRPTPRPPATLSSVTFPSYSIPSTSASTPSMPSTLLTPSTPFMPSTLLAPLTSLMLSTPSTSTPSTACIPDSTLLAHHRIQ